MVPIFSAAQWNPADTRPKGPFLSLDSRINLPLKIIYVIITLDLA